MVKTIKIESLGSLNQSVLELINVLGLLNNEPEINCLAFYGEMGAGKTTIIKEICRILNVNDITSSPSFSLVNEYLTIDGRNIYHFDFYRINKKEEVFDLGYEEYFYSKNICLIEWPEKIGSLLPIPHYRIDIQLAANNQRILKIFLVS
jgi:tRNA threonylcarbamoyladenosine biosynthesis protein TsaE